MRQFESDPEWLARRDQREREREECGQRLDVDQQRLVHELCCVGCKNGICVTLGEQCSEQGSAQGYRTPLPW